MNESRATVESEKLLEMHEIRKAFSGVEVLSGVRFDLYIGEVHALVGENGAGKSTLIKILGGVHSDYSGEIEVGGESVRFRSVHEAGAKGISVIHQELSLVGAMSVAENIFLGREIHRGQWLDKSAMIREADELLRDMGVNVDSHRAVGDCPMGIQQMVEICKALAFECRIIVMDEPTSALTEPEVDKLFGIIERLKKRGCGIFYITHKMEEIYRVADRITVLRDGEYIGTVPATELSRSELVQWMVGRKIEEHFPRHVSRFGDRRLDVRKLSVPAVGESGGFLVDNVSFFVRSGEILGVAGLQGSGNSELLAGIFGGYGRAVEGEIWIDGELFKPINPRAGIERGIALVTNDRKETGLVMSMDIVKNSTLASVASYCRYGWLRPGEEMKAASRQARSLSLKAESLLSGVDSLSGGNQQKVVLAKWIDTGPKVLLLDEPTRGVDVGAKHEIYELMNAWTGEGMAVVLITSEMPELLAMSDRIIVMHRGRVTAEFSRDEASQEKILEAAMGQSMGGHS